MQRERERVRGGPVVDLTALIAGREAAAELQQTVVSRERLAGHHPAHAAYVYAQNQVSVFAEQLTALAELAPFVELIEPAEEEYVPSGPPMSPLTRSFFTCWAFFDACVGDETIGTVVLAVGAAFGMDPGLQRVIRRLQQSRMGVYVHLGNDGACAVLEDLVTGERCRAIVQAGYRGQRGELWYARVLVAERLVPRDALRPAVV